MKSILLFLLALLFICGLLRYGDCEKADYNRPLLIEHEHKTRRNYTFMNDSITEVLFNSQARIVPTFHVTHDPTVPAPDYPSNYQTPFPGHEAALSEDPALISPSNITEDEIFSIYTARSRTYIPTTQTSEETSPDTPYMTLYPPGYGPTDPRPETTMNPSVSAYAKKWLQEIATTTADTTKLSFPKLGQIFDYDYSNDGFSLRNRRHQKTTQRKIDNSHFENSPFKHQTRPIIRQTTTVLPISDRINLGSEAKTAGQDFARSSRESDSRIIERTQTFITGTKQRLKPNLLLGMPTIDDDRNPDNNSEYKKISSGSDEDEKYFRIQKLPSTKKQYYSEVHLEQMGAGKQTTLKYFDRHTIFPAPSTQTQSYKNTKEFCPDSHMIRFLLRLTQLISEKERIAVHDVVKHADQIIRSLFRKKHLQWFGQPLIDVTKKHARSLKKSGIDDIQKQAADLHQTLSERRQVLSNEVNRILENADKLYEDNEEVHLEKVLNEFEAYPNVTSNGYWLCNSLINNFLRPYRRFKHRRKREKLIDSVNKALRARFGDATTQQTSYVDLNFRPRKSL